jgi:hypothetical protein
MFLHLPTERLNLILSFALFTYANRLTSLSLLIVLLLKYNFQSLSMNYAKRFGPEKQGNDLNKLKTKKTNAHCERAYLHFC